MFVNTQIVQNNMANFKSNKHSHVYFDVSSWQELMQI